MAPTTAGEFLRAFDIGAIIDLQRVNRLVAARIRPRQKATRLTIDLDPSLCAQCSTAKQGARMNHKGEVGYYPLFAFWAEEKELLATHLLRGNAHAAPKAVWFLKLALKQASADLPRFLRAEVEALLLADATPDSLIDAPALDVAAQLFAQEQTLSGRRISHYQILSLLGAGGMGEVYLAEDTRLHRKVALKLLPALFTQDAERLRRFKQEAQAASVLNHPNILTIHDVGEAAGFHFIATEYVEGQTLRQRLLKGRLPLNELLDIAQQTASALEAAHRAGIIHRDIKPANVMRRPDGLVKVWEQLLYVGDEAGNRDIWLQHVGGSTTINLTRDSTATDTQPAFSPDGEQIAFRAERDGGGIFLMGATGENVRRLTNQGYNPAWSPDGTEIVYALGFFNDVPSNRSVVPSALHIVNVQTGAPWLLQFIAVSPDNRFLSLSVNRTEADIWLATLP